MTNLSKELCEICGIERKGKLIFRKRDWDGRSWISVGRGYKEFDFETIPEVTVDIIPTKDYKETNGFQYPYTDIEKIKKIYNEHGYDFVEFRQNVIDFTSPENFIKLYNLSLASKHTPTLARFMSFEYSVINNSEDFIKKLVECLEDNIDVNFIKQAIRETEWVYE